MMKSKKYFIGLLLLVSFFWNNLTAQNNSEARTLLDEKNLVKNVGFALTPSYVFTSMDGSFASLLSVRGGISFNERFTLGGFYNFSLNDVQPKSEIIPNIYLDYRAVGGFLEYTIYSDRILHFTFPLLIGGGEVEMDNEVGEVGLGEQNFFLVEPMAMVEINLHKHVRLNIGTGHRFVSEMNYRNFNQSDISGFSGYVGVKVGIF